MRYIKFNQSIGGAVVLLCLSAAASAQTVGYAWAYSMGRYHNWTMAYASNPVSACAKSAALDLMTLISVDPYSFNTTQYNCTALWADPAYPQLLGSRSEWSVILVDDRCALGYTMQADGTCSPTRLPVQVCTAGSPVTPGTGTTGVSTQDEGGSAELPVTLAYRSYSIYGASDGAAQWTSNWQRSLDTNAATYSNAQVTVLRDDGSVYGFRKSGAAWAASSTQDTLSSVTDASGTTTGWQYTVVDTGAVETYDASGKLQSVRERNAPYYDALLQRRESTDDSHCPQRPQPGLRLRQPEPCSECDRARWRRHRLRLQRRRHAVEHHPTRRYDSPVRL